MCAIELVRTAVVWCTTGSRTAADKKVNVDTPCRDHTSQALRSGTRYHQISQSRPPGIPVLKLKSPPAQRKIPENSRCLLIKLIIICNTSTLYTACIPYAVFMGRGVLFVGLYTNFLQRHITHTHGSYFVSIVHNDWCT